MTDAKVSKSLLETETKEDEEVDPVLEEAAAEGKRSPSVRGNNEPLTVFSDEAYACDRQCVIVFAQLIAVKDREKVFKWIERLDTMNTCEEQREERDMYLRFLNLSVSHGKLVPPFNKLPQPGLRPLSTVMPKAVFNLIYKGKYTSGECPVDQETRTPVYSLPDEIEPSSFFGRQPVPRNGGLVYGAAFSLKK